jgi:hypothetical protein
MGYCRAVLLMSVVLGVQSASCPESFSQMAGPNPPRLCEIPLRPSVAWKFFAICNFDPRC